MFSEGYWGDPGKWIQLMTDGVKHALHNKIVKELEGKATVNIK